MHRPTIVTIATAIGGSATFLGVYIIASNLMTTLGWWSV